MDRNRPIYDNNEAYGRVLARQAELHYDDFDTDERTLGQGQWTFVLPGHAHEANHNFNVTRSTPLTAQELRRRVMLPVGTTGLITRGELEGLDNHIIWVPAGHAIEATHLRAIAQGQAEQEYHHAELILVPIPETLRDQVEREETAITLSQMPQTGATSAPTNPSDVVDAATILHQARAFFKQLERELAEMTLTQMHESGARSASTNPPDVTDAATILVQISILCERLGQEIAAFKANKQRKQSGESEDQSDEHEGQYDEQVEDDSGSASEDVEQPETTSVRRTAQQIRDQKDANGISRPRQPKYAEAEESFLRAWSEVFGSTYRQADLRNAFRRAFPNHTHGTKLTGLVEKQKRVHAAGGPRVHHEVKGNTFEYTAATRQWNNVRLPQWEQEQRLAPRQALKPAKKPRVQRRSKSIKDSQAAVAPKRITSIKLIVTKPKTPTIKLTRSKRPREEEDEDEKDQKDGDKGSPAKKKKPDNTPKK